MFLRKILDRRVGDLTSVSPGKRRRVSKLKL